MPQAAGITKQLVTYKRADGVPLSFTLYLPANYKPGTKLPTVMWAYPYEFSDADTAGQVTGHEAQAFPELNYHQLVTLHGYALLDNAAMPIIGDPDTVNNTYVEQIQMDAQAAIDKAVEMGVSDRDQIGVFGHSYGAFMTANLMAHTKLFHAAVAESGAYNRTSHAVRFPVRAAHVLGGSRCVHEDVAVLVRRQDQDSGAADPWRSRRQHWHIPDPVGTAVRRDSRKRRARCAW